MELAARIAQVIIPVFFIVAVGFFYGRHARPELTSFNRIVLDVLAPALVYSALAAKESSSSRIMGEVMLALMLFALGVRLTALRRQDVPRGLLGNALAVVFVPLGLALSL